MKYYDDEEKKLIESVERGEWVPVADLKGYLEEAKRIAEQTTKKDQRMNIRIAKKDLDAIRAKALEEGIPYQTLVSGILHKYVSGQLIESKKKVS